MTRGHQHQHPRLLYVEKATMSMGQSADATEADADEAEEGVEEGWTGRLHSTSAEDEEGVSDSSRRRSRRRPKKALPVQLLPSDEGRSEAMMIGLPYRLQASSAPPPPQSGPVALSPLERAAAAVAATAAGPNSPPPMALAAATAAAAPPAAPPAQGAGGGRGGLANELMAAAGWRPAASAAPRPFTKVALVATPDPEAAFDAMAIRRLQALLCLAALVQVLATAFLLFPPGAPTTMDPSLVDPSPPYDGPIAPPSPFQRPNPTTNSFHAFVPIFGVGAAIACLGAAAALLRSPLGLKLYSLAAFLHLLCAAPLSPTPTLGPALTTVVVPIALAERLYARLVPSSVVVSSSGLARRFR